MEVISVFFLGKAGRHQLDHEKTSRLALDEANYVSSFKKLEKNLKAWQFKKTKELSEAVAIHGKIKAKAFPARAAILLKMLNVDETIVEAVYEKPGSKKLVITFLEQESP